MFIFVRKVFIFEQKGAGLVLKIRYGTGSSTWHSFWAPGMSI